MILLVIKITLSTSLINIENNKQIKLAKKSRQAACRDTRRGYPNSTKRKKNLTFPDQMHGHGISSKVNDLR
jgi:hypothetical protein